MSIVDFPKAGTIGTSLKPKRYDIELYQGDSFDVSITFKQASGAVVDLSGVTIRAKIVLADGTAAPAQFDSSGSDLVNGVVRLVIDDTSQLSGDYRWDLQLQEGTKQRTYIGGLVTVTEDITP